MSGFDREFVHKMHGEDELTVEEMRRALADDTDVRPEHLLPLFRGGTDTGLVVIDRAALSELVHYTWRLFDCPDPC